VSVLELVLVDGFFVTWAYTCFVRMKERCYFLAIIVVFVIVALLLVLEMENLHPALIPPQNVNFL